MVKSSRKNDIKLRLSEKFPERFSAFRICKQKYHSTTISKVMTVWKNFLGKIFEKKNNQKNFLITTTDKKNKKKQKKN